MSIGVEALTDGSWAVRVEATGTETHHVITVPPGYAEALGGDGTNDAELVRASFAFLLDREPAGSILHRFSLDIISRYFPDYGVAVREYLPGVAPNGDAAG
jgi:hypothetical protein